MAYTDMAFIVMACIAMAYTDMAFIVMAYTDTAFVLMTYIGLNLVGVDLAVSNGLAVWPERCFESCR